MTTEMPMPETAGQSAQPTTDNNEFIDKSELGRRLGIHQRTVDRMVKRGELPRPCIGEGRSRPRWLWRYVVEFCQEQHHRKLKLDRKARERMA